MENSGGDLTPQLRRRSRKKQRRGFKRNDDNPSTDSDYYQGVSREGCFTSSISAEKSSPPPELPDEVTEEVLSRLPVKDLLRFRSVCKKWKTLISDPNFVKKQLVWSANDTNLRSRYVILCTGRNCLSSFSLSALYSGQPAVATPHFNDFRGYIKGSCNGLVCLVTEYAEIVLWNPSTRKVKALPGLDLEEHRGDYFEYGFGYDHSNDDYKVVAIIKRNHEVIGVSIYSLKAKCWRSIQRFYHHNLSGGGKFLNGTLYWLAGSKSMGNRRVIVSLDLATEKFSDVLTPEFEFEFDNDGSDSDGPIPEFYYEESTFSLGVLGGRLCLIIRRFWVRTDIWLLRDQNDKESWQLLVSIYHESIPTVGANFKVPIYGFDFRHPIWISDNGEILLKRGEDLVLYNTKTNRVRFPSIRRDELGLFCEVIGMESLISPCVDNKK